MSFLNHACGRQQQLRTFRRCTKPSQNWKVAFVGFKHHNLRKIVVMLSVEKPAAHTGHMFSVPARLL